LNNRKNFPADFVWLVEALMKLGEFLKILLQRLNSGLTQPDGGPPSRQAQEVLEGMIRKIEQTQDIELACGEVFDLLDQYAEKAAHGEDAAQLMPLVRQHLGMCPDCREEFEALLKVLQSSPAIS
jgi:hypothetical protein